MPVVEAEARKWGNSLGILIPKDVVKREKIKANQKIDVVILLHGRTLERAFGSLKIWKKPTQKIKDEIRRELYGK